MTTALHSSSLKLTPYELESRQTPNNIAPKNSSKIESSEEYELNLSQHFHQNRS